MTWTKLQDFVILWPGWECDSDGSLWRSETGEYGLASRLDAEGPSETTKTDRTLDYLEERIRYYEEIVRETKVILNAVKEGS